MSEFNLPNPEMKSSSNFIDSSRKSSEVFARHKLKFLNSFLLLYICFGALAFDYLNEEPVIRQNNSTATLKLRNEFKSDRAAVNLTQLRIDSVRRMWNITNQLNILYESNWTHLVLDELVQFERKLIESIKILSNETDDDELGLDLGVELELDSGEKSPSHSQDNQEESKRRGNSEQERLRRQQQQRRYKSIKKSILHSIATITTIGLPDNSQPKGQTSKLFTILYGAFGIPLLFVTVSQTGKQMASKSYNSLLTIRHYCFALPSYYLCCSCSPFQCFRSLAWCCCCCCCCRYIFCLSDKIFKVRRKKPPRLEVPKTRGRQRSPGGATEFENKNLRVPYMISNANEFAGNQQLKSVRFFNANSVTSEGDNFQPREGINADTFKDNATTRTDDYDAESDNIYSGKGLFSTSVVILAVYFLLGAYYYSKSHSMSLIDSMFDCYSMLSMSKLPESLSLSSGKKDALNVYETLRGNLENSNQKIASNTGLKSTSQDTSVLDLIYFLIGLNLVSMVSHFAHLSFKKLKEQNSRASNYKLVGESSGSNAQEMLDVHHQVAPSIVGSFDNSTLFGGPQAAVQSGYLLQSASPAQQLLTEIPSLNSVDNSQKAIQSAPVAQQQMNLAELYVVGHHESPIETINANYNQQVALQQQQQAASDVSFASDKSTGSLCLHHQNQKHQHSVGGSSGNNGQIGNDVYGLSATLHRHGHQQMKQNPPSGHLYLPNNHIMMSQTLIGNHADADDDDAQEVDRMLATCMRTGQQAMVRSSSSSNNLSMSANRQQFANYKRPLLSNGNHLSVNGGEQDSSLNSNTISSVSSNRFIRQRPSSNDTNQDNKHYYQHHHYNNHRPQHNYDNKHSKVGFITTMTTKTLIQDDKDDD